MNVCSVTVYRSREGRSGQCGNPVKVEREGLPYCTIHDPQRSRAKEISKCWMRVRGRLCGRPAVETQYGYGRCAAHSRATVEAQRRLQEAAPALLAACKALLRPRYSNLACPWCGHHYEQHHADCPALVAEAAIKAAEGQP